MSTASRGSAREHQVKRLLEGEGWAVTRGAGSHGCADLWAAKVMEKQIMQVEMWASLWETRLRLVQVKSDKRGPFAHFGPKDRQELRSLAVQTGGTAELVHWPARGKPRWYTQDEWPDDD